MLIKKYQGVKDRKRKRIYFPSGIMRDGTPYEIVLYLSPVPSMTLLDAVQEDLEYLQRPH